MQFIKSMLATFLRCKVSFDVTILKVNVYYFVTSLAQNFSSLCANATTGTRNYINTHMYSFDQGVGFVPSANVADFVTNYF